MQVIDNFLAEEDFKNIQNSIFHSQHFPWFYNSGIAYPTEEEVLYDFQFVHTFYSMSYGKSTEISKLSPLLKKINPKTVYRIKANLGPITPTHMQTGWHTDFDDLQCTTAVFYLNTNNGYTIFENGDKVESVENRLVMFDSKLVHAAVSCTDKNVRCVLNLNFDL